jgi:WD40 repeat protein
MLFLTPPSASAQAPKGPVSFINDVAPILKENCMGCHGAKNPKGKLDMTRYESFRKGGTKDDPIAPGKPDESYIIDVLTATDNKRMPPKDSGDPLPKTKIAVIEQWIKEGAKLDAGLNPKSDIPRELRARWTPPAPPAVYPYPVTITSVAFTPDSKKLVVSGHHELTVWDVASGKLEKRIRTRAQRAMAMVFLPDGNLVVAGSRPGQEGDVRVYNIKAGTPKIENGVAVVDGVNDKAVLVKQLLEADDEVLCLALSPDGKKLASGGTDRIVNVWDIAGGIANAKLEQSIENHADWVFGVAIAADNQHLFTCSRDKTAKVWDLKTKESVLTFPDHQNGVYGVGAKADGKIGYSVGEDNQLRAWNAAGDQAGKQVRTSGGHGAVVLKLAAVPGQPMLVTCSADKTVRVWNADSGAAVRTMTGHTDYVYGVAVSPDAKLVASGSFNGEVKIWNLADGKPVKEFNGSPGLQTATAPVAPKK